MREVVGEPSQCPISNNESHKMLAIWRQAGDSSPLANDWPTRAACGVMVLKSGQWLMTRSFRLLHLADLPRNKSLSVKIRVIRGSE